MLSFQRKQQNIVLFIRFSYSLALKCTFNPENHAIVLEALLEERNYSSRGRRTALSSSRSFLFFLATTAYPALAARHGVVKNERIATFSLPRVLSDFIWVPQFTPAYIYMIVLFFSNVIKQVLLFII